MLESAAADMTREDIEQALHIYAMARWNMTVNNDLLTRRPIFFSPAVTGDTDEARDVFNLLMDHISFNVTTAANESGDEKEAMEMLKQEYAIGGEVQRKTSGGGKKRKSDGKSAAKKKRVHKSSADDDTAPRQYKFSYRDLTDREIDQLEKQDNAATNVSNRRKGPMQRLIQQMEKRLMQHMTTILREHERTLRMMIDQYMRGDIPIMAETSSGEHEDEEDEDEDEEEEENEDEEDD